MLATVWHVRAALLVVVAVPAAAHAAPHHCLDEPGAKLILDETLVGVVNPLGVENQLKASACWPLVERPGLLFDYTSVELGLYDNLSPIYVQQGAFVAVTPLSPLVVRVEAAGVQYWPLPLSGAGYYAVSGYRADYREAALPASSARAATGLEAGASATLQGAAPVAKGWAIVVQNAFVAEYWLLGDAAYYVNMRRDAIVARSDVLVKNTALLLVEHKRGRAVMRAGAVDDLTAVPRAGYVANSVGGAAMIDFRHVRPSLHELSAFVRVSGYTAHAFRAGATVFFGVSAVWERKRR
jgi:hypothetical protein